MSTTSLQNDPQIQRALAMVLAGGLGYIVSVDILLGAEYPAYEGGALPPWYRAAGYPMRDLGVQCLALLRELLGEIEDVDADWRSLGGDPSLAFDEWRVMVRCQRGLAQFQLSYNIKPAQSQVVIHGTTGAKRIDLHRRPARRATDAEPPIPISENATTWAERIAREADADHEAHVARFPLSDKVPYLVTGGAGSLGRAIVKRLRDEGHQVRVLQRRFPEHPQAGIEYAFGNLGDPAAVARAVQGADVVIHCGAATKGGWLEHKVGTVIGTQNVLDAVKNYAVKQLIHISSMSVIDWAGNSGKGPITEAADPEPRAEARGAYTRAKLEAEQLVLAAAKDGLPVVILRPGQIFGGGINLINGAVARSAGGRWLVLGDGELELPLVYLDDVVDAVMAAIAKKLTRGELFQIIDPEHLTQNDVLELAGGKKRVLRIPRAVVFALGRLSELPMRALGKPSPIGLYRLKSALARLRYESDHAERALGWKPRIGVREGIRRVSSAGEPSASKTERAPATRVAG
ncbi:hypothetical protein BH11MYX3_BH11MYX3_14140 [soil metagenome]